MRGTVVVQLQHSSAAAQQPQSAGGQVSGAVCLVVTDQGRGFSEDVMQRFGRTVAEMDAMWPVSALSVGLTSCKRAFCALGCSFEISNVTPDAKRKGGRITVQFPMTPTSADA